MRVKKREYEQRGLEVGLVTDYGVIFARYVQRVEFSGVI
jgi:hypothetical protein